MFWVWLEQKGSGIQLHIITELESGVVEIMSCPHDMKVKIIRLESHLASDKQISVRCLGDN